MVAMFYRSKIPIATGLQGWSTISLPVGILFISSHARWSIWTKKLPIIEQMSAMKSFRFWKNCLTPCALMHQKLPIMPGLLDTWTWSRPSIDLCAISRQWFQKWPVIAPFSSCNCVIPWLKMPSQMTCILPRTWQKSWLLVLIQGGKPSC